MTNYTDYNKLSKIGDKGEQRFIEFLQDRDFTNITNTLMMCMKKKD